jgi:GxxExxY protein
MWPTDYTDTHGWEEKKSVSICVNLWANNSFLIVFMTKDDKTYAIIGACFEVYNQMGCGFLEAVYQECLDIEFEHRGIPYAAQPEIKLDYRDRELRQKYYPDFICFDEVIVELKATSELHDEHYAQLLNYLNATNFSKGLLVNFGHYPKLEYKRMVL